MSVAYGPNSAGTAADGGGTYKWSGGTPLSVVGAPNYGYSYCDALVNAQISNYLKTTNYGFAIPAGATIDGIIVSVYHASTGAGVKDSEVKIIKADGSIGTTNKASASNWSYNRETIDYGSPSDLWGETWTPANINDVDFGVALKATVPGATSLEPKMDAIQITVYCTIPTSLKTVNGLVIASVKTKNGLAIASVKTWNGLA